MSCRQAKQRKIKQTRAETGSGFHQLDEQLANLLDGAHEWLG
jgi:hypothetical protein